MFKVLDRARFYQFMHAVRDFELTDGLAYELLCEMKERPAKTPDEILAYWGHGKVSK